MDLLAQLKGLKFMTTLVLVFKKIESKDASKYEWKWHWWCVSIISNIQKSLGKRSGWIIASVIDHTISVSNCNNLAKSVYIKLRKELDHPIKEFINISNIDDNEYLKWCLVR